MGHVTAPLYCSLVTSLYIQNNDVAITSSTSQGSSDLGGCGLGGACNYNVHETFRLCPFPHQRQLNIKAIAVCSIEQQNLSTLYHLYAQLSTCHMCFKPKLRKNVPANSYCHLKVYIIMEILANVFSAFTFVRSGLPHLYHQHSSDGCESCRRTLLPKSTAHHPPQSSP